MAKEKFEEHRFDFRGGLNDHDSVVLLQPNEFSRLTNCVIDAPDGALKLRLGSRRLHQTALLGRVTGVQQWNNAGTLQLVAIADGDLHYKTTDFGAFTNVSPAPAMAAQTAYFAPNRQNTSGAPLRLYITDGTYYWRWSGSALTQIDGTDDLPTATDMVRAYHVRNFVRSTLYPNNVFWSELGDPEDGTQGLRTLGGSAMVDTLKGDPISAIEVVGSSLLIGTDNSIVRFTGYDSSDIQINQDTEGISSTVGPVGRQCLVRAEKWAGMVAATGIFAVSEAEALLLSHKISTSFRALDRANLHKSVVQYHEGARELWIAVPGASDSGLNKTVFIYSLDLGIWYGPHTYSFGIVSMCKWEDSNGDEYVAAGCEDGYVRVLGYPTAGLDDVLYDASGGSAVTAVARLAPIYFNPGPGVRKVVHTFTLHSEEANVLVGVFVEGSANSITTLITNTGEIEPYRTRANLQGTMFEPQLEWSGHATRIHGVSLFAYTTDRPSV